MSLPNQSRLLVSLPRLRELLTKNLMLWSLLAVALFQFGRGPGNMLWGPLAIFCALTLLSNWQQLLRLPVFGLSLAAYIILFSTAGIGAAETFPPWALKYWLSTVCSAMVFFCLQLYPPDFREQRDKAAQIALLAVAALAVHWLYFIWVVGLKELQVAREITGPVAAVLAPWIFIHSAWSVLKKWFLMFSLMGLLMLLDSRTEVLALLVALCVYQLCCWKSLRWLLLFVPLLLLLVLLPELMSNGRSENINFASLNQISSSRMEIWSAAIEACKESLWYGHGLYSSVRAEFLPNDIRHIHNIVLEIVYETGILGLLAIFCFMACAFLPAVRKSKHWPKADRRQAAVILASAAATVVVLFFDKSLHSIFARFYLFTLAGLAYSLYELNKKSTPHLKSESGSQDEIGRVTSV